MSEGPLMSRDRDRKLEQALTHELRAAGTPDRDACVDAETLGAWADGGLEAGANGGRSNGTSRRARDARPSSAQRRERAP